MAFIYLLVAVILCGGTLWLWRVRKAQIVTLPVETPPLVSLQHNIPEDQATPQTPPSAETDTIEAEDITGSSFPALRLQDVTAHSLGIAVQGGRFYKLIEKESRIPHQATIVLFSNVGDSDKEMVVEIYQGEEEIVSGNTKIGEVPIKIEPVPPGPHELEMQFSVHTDGTLAVRITDLQTQNEYEHYFARPTRLSMDELKAKAGELDASLKKYRTKPAESPHTTLAHPPASSVKSVIQTPQTIEYVGKVVLPKRVYVGDAQNISLIMHLNVKIPGLLPESLLVKEFAESDRQVPGQEGNKQVEAQIQQKDSSEQYLEVELIAAGFTIAGDLKQRQSLAPQTLAYLWNCYFPNSGNQALTLVLRVIHPSGCREVGTISHSIKVAKLDHLTQRQIGMVTWLAGAAGFLSTIVGIISALHLFGLR